MAKGKSSQELFRQLYSCQIGRFAFLAVFTVVSPNIFLLVVFKNMSVFKAEMLTTSTKPSFQNHAPCVYVSPCVVKTRRS